MAMHGISIQFEDYPALYYPMRPVVILMPAPIDKAAAEGYIKSTGKSVSVEEVIADIEEALS